MVVAHLTALPRKVVSAMPSSPIMTPDVLRHVGLLELFCLAADPRDPRGVRHPLGVLLAGALAAVLAGARSFAAIGKWARCADPEVAEALGMAARPEASTFRRVLCALDAAAFDLLVGAWMWLRCANAGGRTVISFDGKTVRGAKTRGGTAPHLLSAMVHGVDAVVAQAVVGEKSNEIPKLRDLLGRLAIAECVIVADAMHTQRETARAIVEAGADYLFTVKKNQPGTLASIARLPWKHIPSRTWVDTSKGRRVRRTIKVVAAAGWTDFPHASQIAQLRRTRTVKGKTTTEVVYLICSAPAAQASPEQLATWVKSHWCIENRFHWVRDVSYDEDRQTARSGHGPQNMACLRNLAISILHLAGLNKIAGSLRENAYRPKHLLELLLTSGKETLL